MDQKDGWGHSTFHAAQVSLYRRVARGLNWGTEYMWSHAINNNSLGGGEGTQPQIATCRACDKGNSGQDVRHTVTANWVYQFPFGPGQSRLTSGPLAHILGGWETSGIWMARTGRMLTIVFPAVPALCPTATRQASGPTFSRCFDLPGRGANNRTMAQSCRVLHPANGTWGNAGRSIAVGPGLAQLDFSLQKRTRITEGTAILFRADMFNVVNHTQPANPGTTFTSPASFGIITSGLNRTIGTGTSRQIQFSLRFTF